MCDKMSHNENQISLSAIEEVFDRKLLPIAMKLDQCATIVEGLVQSVSVISDKFDEISTKVEDLEGKYMKVNQENKFLKDEVFRLSNSLNSVKVTGHPFWRFAENRYCALNISPILIKISPNVRQCMQNMVKL